MLFWHATLASNLGNYIQRQMSGDETEPVGRLGQVLFDTPLRLLTMGTQAVPVFFVLSGVVLILPMVRGRALDMWAYYPRRVLRLWIPCAASILLAIALILVVPQRPENAVSQWSKDFTFQTIDPWTTVSSFFLITGDVRYNNPLWSLRWEMIFSLFLPIAFIFVLLMRRWIWAGVAACAVVSTLGAIVKVGAVQYAPMFLAGGLIAYLIDSRPPPRPAASWAMVIGGLTLIGVPDMYRSYLHGVMLDPSGLALSGCIVAGAALVIRGLSAPSRITSAFGSRPFRFLGRISFSLYLVHVPIMIAVINLVPGYATQSLLISVPLALAVAWLFAKYVEEPSARLAKRAGERVTSMVKVRAATAART